MRVFFPKSVPVIEFGLCNATMHKVDEAVAVQDLEVLTDIYEGIVRKVAVSNVPPGVKRSLASASA